jgi:hypothetical protein
MVLANAGHRKDLPSTSFLRKKPNPITLTGCYGVPALEMGFMCARIEAITKPAFDRAKSHSLCSLRGAMAGIAYMFMDFHSNYWSMAGVL